MRPIILAALVSGSCLIAVPAIAKPFIYACKVAGKSYDLKVDDEHRKLVWQGTTYNIKVQDSCAKYGWRAEGRGEAFDFCTATKGYADFQEKGSLIQCDLK